MKRLLLLALAVCSGGFSLAAAAEGIALNRVLSDELALSDADAELYWEGLSWTLGSIVAGGRRVALDGLGAFEPCYVNGADGEAVRSMSFDFDLGPSTEHPCFTSVFDEDFLQVLSSYAWLAGTGGAVERRLTNEEWSKLLDCFVFCVLRNIDGHARLPLALDLGHFFPTIDVDLSTERDNNQRRLVLNFFADDDSPEKFAWQYETSVDTLRHLTAVLDREADHLKRLARLTRIPEYTEAEGIVRAVSAAWTADLDDLGGSRAQDHNSSRSNKTASILAEGVGDLAEAQNAIKAAAAQDHNSSRSNKTASAISNVEDGGAWASETLAAPAQDHNSSRSNKTASRSSAFYDDLLMRYDDAYSTPAQDHNSARSNKTASVVVDFEPGPGLEAMFRSADF